MQTMEQSLTELVQKNLITVPKRSGAPAGPRRSCPRSNAPVFQSLTCPSTAHLPPRRLLGAALRVAGS